MKLTDVPQDVDPSYEGGKRLTYAVDANGQYVQAHSAGWEAEMAVKGQAWKAIDTELASLRAGVRSGTVSSLFYHMRARQMDLPLLAQNMGLWKIFVWWHLRPSTRLSEQQLRAYADCLEVPFEQLRDFKG